MPKKNAPAKEAPVATAEAPEETKEPEGVGLKEIAKAVGLEPRATRALLRSINYRSDDKKRSRWVFTKEEAPQVIATIKAEIKKKADAKAAKAAEVAAAGEGAEEGGEAGGEAEE